MTQRKRIDFRKPRRPSGVRRERRTYDDGPRYETGLFPTPMRLIVFEPDDMPEIPEPLLSQVKAFAEIAIVGSWFNKSADHQLNAYRDMLAQTDPI